MNHWYKLFICFLKKRALKVNSYKYVYAKTFQRNHKLDKFCTREIILFFLSRNNRANLLRLCLNKFISCNGSESEIS